MLAEEQRGLARLLALVGMLCGRRYWKVQELANEFKVNRTTIYRNIWALEAAGFPLDQDYRGWRIPEDQGLPITFSASELFSLHIAASIPALNSGVPLSEPLKSALRKIENLVSPGLVRSTRRRGTRVQVCVPSHGDSRTLNKVFSLLEKAMRARRQVSVSYQPLNADKPSEYILSPLALFFRRHSWYTVATTLSYAQPLTFKLIRFKKVEMLKDRFEPPPDFSLDSYLEKAWELFTGEPVDVTVKFAPRLEPLLEEEQRHSTQRVDHLPDGSAILHVQVPLAPDFIGWLLGFGAEVEVLSPPELRKQMKETAEEMLMIYAPSKVEKAFLKADPEKR